MDPQTKPDVEYLTSERAKGLPFVRSSARRHDVVPVRDGWNGKLHEVGSGGIKAETRQTMENIKARLERYGSSLDHVVKVTVFMADMSEWEEMNKVYVAYFKHLPARTAIGSHRDWSLVHVWKSSASLYCGRATLPRPEAQVQYEFMFRGRPKEGP